MFPGIKADGLEHMSLALVVLQKRGRKKLNVSDPLQFS
jgi:hypothetical protein